MATRPDRYRLLIKQDRRRKEFRFGLFLTNPSFSYRMCIGRFTTPEQALAFARAIVEEATRVWPVANPATPLLTIWTCVRNVETKAP